MKKVEVCIVDTTNKLKHVITDRVKVPCEVLSTEGIFSNVRLTEAGGVLPVGHEMKVPSVKVTEEP